jgi:hypothetical protein
MKLLEAPRSKLADLSNVAPLVYPLPSDVFAWRSTSLMLVSRSEHFLPLRMFVVFSSWYRIDWLHAEDNFVATLGVISQFPWWYNTVMIGIHLGLC